MWNVWRTVLEENEKLARARLAAVEVFQQQIADDAKSLKMHKIQISKKVHFDEGIYRKKKKMFVLVYTRTPLFEYIRPFLLRLSFRRSTNY